MELYDVIDITVSLGSSAIDRIVFRRQPPELITSPRNSSSYATNVWFVLSPDVLNCDITKNLKSTRCEHSKCIEDGSEMGVLMRECISGEESADPRNRVIFENDLPPDRNYEQKRGRTKPDNAASAREHFAQFRTDIDLILASCFMFAMRHSQPYRRLFLKNFCERCGSTLRSTKLRRRCNGIGLTLDLRTSSLFSMEPDVRWSQKMLPLWLARVSMEDSFSWLSTLGGAYSALGDHFHNFAEKAGKVSVHQMKLACQIGDPILLARCRVYMAQSLMQKGFIPQAMFIVRAQYRFAVSLGDSTDQRLINMCKGVWSIIQYVHKREKGRRKNGVGLHPPSSEAS